MAKNKRFNPPKTKLIVERKKRSSAARARYAAERLERDLIEAMRLEVVMEAKLNPEMSGMTKETEYQLAKRFLDRLRNNNPRAFANFCSRVGN